MLWLWIVTRCEEVQGEQDQMEDKYKYIGREAIREMMGDAILGEEFEVPDNTATVVSEYRRYHQEIEKAARTQFKGSLQGESHQLILGPGDVFTARLSIPTNDPFIVSVFGDRDNQENEVQLGVDQAMARLVVEVEGESKQCGIACVYNVNNQIIQVRIQSKSSQDLYVVINADYGRRTFKGKALGDNETHQIALESRVLAGKFEQYWKTFQRLNHKGKQNLHHLARTLPRLKHSCWAQIVGVLVIAVLQVRAFGKLLASKGDIF